jgi:hypothetical protein
MGYHRRLFVFVNYDWQEKSEHATPKNKLGLRCLSADRLRQPSHLTTGIPGAGSATAPSDCLPIRQLLGIQLHTRDNALPGLTKCGHREPV